MTAITKADIPADIVTLEQLAAWCSVALATLNSAATVVEGAGIVERACQANPYFIAASTTNRLLVRLSLELAPDYLVRAEKIWMSAMPFSETELPASLRVS
jgi:hypothetical protein